MYRVVWPYVHYCKNMVHKLSHKSFGGKGLRRKSGRNFAISPFTVRGYEEKKKVLFLFGFLVD
jgi:hypothetical protein